LPFHHQADPVITLSLPKRASYVALPNAAASEVDPREFPTDLDNPNPRVLRMLEWQHIWLGINHKPDTLALYLLH
jgi:hypothetical protein